MKKIVNGEEVEMSSEEEAAILKEWAENDPDSEKNKALETASRARQYLEDTDYLVIRAGTEGYSLDPAIKLKREQARDAIREYRKYT